MERSLMEQSGVTDEQIRNAIDQGAITKQYLAQPEHVVSSLNRLRSTEITSYLQYNQHGYMAVSLLSPGLKAEFEAHAEQELSHADRLATRIQQLGGVPIFDLQELAGKAAAIGVHPEQGTTLAEMVVENLLLERRQVEVERDARPFSRSWCKDRQGYFFIRWLRYGRRRSRRCSSRR